MLKPATLTPACTALFVDILAEAGLPPGVLNVVVGSGREVGETIVASPAIRAVSFTGSNAVGQGLYVKAASRGIKVTCEMGGKNAVVVLADADLDQAAVAIHGGAFGSTGQRCTATSRVIALEGVKDELLERLVPSARAIKVGNGLDESIDMGPAVDADQLATDLEYIAIGKGEGARLVTGGGRPGRARRRPLRRAHHLRRGHALDAHLQGGDLRPGARGLDRALGRGGARGAPTPSSSGSPPRSSRATSMP